MAEMMVITEKHSARRLIHSLRARRMAVSQMNDGSGRSITCTVRLLVKVPAHRVQEVYEILASGS